MTRKGTKINMEREKRRFSFREMYFVPNNSMVSVNPLGGGSKRDPGMRASLWVQFLSFSCSFLGKFWQDNKLAPHLGCWRPLPVWEILDPPLSFPMEELISIKGLKPTAFLSVPAFLTESTHMT